MHIQPASAGPAAAPAAAAGPGHAAGPSLGTPGGLLLRMLRRSMGWTGLLAAAGTAGAVAQALLPAALGGAVDAILGTGAAGRTPWGWLGRLGGPAGWLAVLAVLAAVAVGCDALSQLGTGATAAGATAWLRHSLLRHILVAGPRITRSYPAGDVVSRVIGGAADAGGAPAGAALTVAALIPAAGGVAALLLIDRWLGVALCLGLPLLAVMLRQFVRDTSEVVTRYQEAQGAIAGRLLEALAGARTIAAAGTAAGEAARVLAPLPDLRRHGDQTWRIQGRVSAQGTLLVPLLQVLVLTVGGLELARHRISPGELIAASQYAVLGAGAGAAIAHLGRLARARAGAVRAAGLLSADLPRYGTRALPPGPGCLEFRRVTVKAGGDVILDAVDLVIPGGAAVAVVGRSGAGKSVLAALPGRLADPDHGQVLLDGVPVRVLTRDGLRGAVRYAFGRPSLLGWTVEDAIRFGDPPAAPAQARAGAVAACADGFLRRLPAGYQTPVADAPLSGGEAQRLGLARAFAHAPGIRVLILDDATSSLDTVTEREVSRALSGEFSGLTRLIVTHRAGTAARADLVAWLEGGRLLALRPHAELWAVPRYRAVFGEKRAG
ncbi:MAG: ATP-binding cassette domain-containing protein [Gemmatimonadota bacterium]